MGLWQAGQQRHTGEHWHTLLGGISMFAVHTMHKMGDKSFRTSHIGRMDFYLRTSGICEPNRGVLNIGGTRDAQCEESERANHGIIGRCT